MLGGIHTTSDGGEGQKAEDGHSQCEMLLHLLGKEQNKAEVGHRLC